MSCLQKQRFSLQPQLQNGMLTSMLKWMMMSMSIWVRTASTSLLCYRKENIISPLLWLSFLHVLLL